MQDFSEAQFKYISIPLKLDVPKVLGFFFKYPENTQSTDSFICENVLIVKQFHLICDAFYRPWDISTSLFYKLFLVNTPLFF